eukprot:4776409-Prymnesium_polylepis.1
MNKSLGLYDPLFIIPLLQSSYITFGATASGIFYRGLHTNHRPPPSIRTAAAPPPHSPPRARPPAHRSYSAHLTPLHRAASMPRRTVPACCAA